MQEFNKIKVIGIDHGYGNIKTANTVTPTGVIVSARYTNHLFSIKPRTKIFTPQHFWGSQRNAELYGSIYHRKIIKYTKRCN